LFLIFRINGGQESALGKATKKCAQLEKTNCVYLCEKIKKEQFLSKLPTGPLMLRALSVLVVCV
jgi:hypothetical protein